MSTILGLKFAVDPLQALYQWFEEGEPVISVRMPAVHTRERLLNDRFEQVEWLDEQLSHTKEHAPPELTIKEESTVTRTRGKEGSSTSKEQIESSQKTEAVQASAHTHDLTSTVGVPGPLNWFRALDSYRDVLRGERAIAMLDDRHDLDGNELYFLTFDTSIIAGPGEHGYAVVNVTVAPEAEQKVPSNVDSRLNLLQEQDYRDIYFDWMERLQRELDRQIDLNHRSLVTTQSYPEWLPPKTELEILACLQWQIIRGRIARLDSPRRHLASIACEQAFHPPLAPSESLAIHDEWSSRPGNQALVDTAQGFSTRIQAIEDKINTTLPPLLRDGYQKQASAALRFQGVKEIPVAGLQDYPDYNSAEGTCGKKESPSGSAAFSFSYERLKANLPCPIAIGPLTSLFYLNAIIQALIISGDDGDIQNLNVEFAPRSERPEEIWSVLGVRALPVHMTVTTPGKHTYQDDLGRDVDVSCLTAMLDYDTLNADSGRLLPGRGERLEDWFGIHVERHGSFTCKLSLSPKIKANSRISAPDQSADGIDDAEDHKLLAKFMSRLDVLAASGSPDPKTVRVAAFSYSLSPRMRQAYSVKRETSSDMRASSAFGGIGSESNGSFDNEAEDLNIVGYEPRRADLDGTGGDASFGWIVSPERKDGSDWAKDLRTQQIELGAVVSAPSWWRSVVLKICSFYSPHLTEASRPTNDRACRFEILRLPGTASDVSRRLGLEVVRYPFLYQTPDVTTTLIAGHSGRMLLEGGRLWRSTVVTLGAQRADRIEVLPNMQGIAAYFKCIETPSLTGFQQKPPDGGDDQLISVPVRVWTSENVTEPTEASILVKRTRQPSDYCKSEFEPRAPPIAADKKVASEAQADVAPKP